MAIKKGDHVIVTKGPHGGIGGSIRRREKSGQFVINVFARGFPKEVRAKRSEIRLAKTLRASEAVDSAGGKVRRL